MENLNWQIFTSLLSGLFGVLVGVWINQYIEIRREKVEAMKILIAYISNPEIPARVITLNSIPIIFHRNKKICALFEDYKKAQSEFEANLSNQTVSSQKYAALADAYIKIIEAIARSLHYSSTISWDKLKNCYCLKSYVDINGQTHWY